MTITPSSHTRRATIADVAREAGVSTATVSNALNGRRRVNSDTELCVRAVAGRLGYVPDLRAQRLRTGDAHTLALLSSMPLSISAGPSRLGFFMEIAASIAVEAMQERLTLMLVPPPEGGAAALPLEHLDIDGAFVLEPLETDPIVERLQARRIPMVSIGRQPGAASHVPPHVDLHPGRTTALLLSHLQAEGAGRIALIVGAQAR
ncbi:MAG: LacI family DNA-binding transcriptional regulator, partial [Janthinobacterium lividum]